MYCIFQSISDKRINRTHAMKQYKKHIIKHPPKHKRQKIQDTPFLQKSSQHITDIKKTSFESTLTAWIGSRSSLVLHTLIFAGSFISIIFGATPDRVLLVLTTVVSLEAIYLAIFIQMSVNKNTASLEEVEEDIEGIQEGVEEITEEIEELQEDVGEMTEEIDSIQEDVNEISEDIEGIQEDIHEEMELNDDEDKKRLMYHKATHEKLIELQDTLRSIMKEIDNLKSKN